MAYLFILPSHLAFWLKGKQGFYSGVTCKLLLISHTHTHTVDQDWPKNLWKQAFTPPISVWWFRGVFFYLSILRLTFFSRERGSPPQVPFPFFCISAFTFCFFVVVFFANFAIISTPTLNPLNTPKETLNDKFLGIAVAEQTHITTYRKWCQVAAVKVEGGVHPRHPSPMPRSRPADPCDPPGMSRCRQPLSSSLAPPHSSSASRKWMHTGLFDVWWNVLRQKQKNIS